MHLGEREIFFKVVVKVVRVVKSRSTATVGLLKWLLIGCEIIYYNMSVEGDEERNEKTEYCDFGCC